MIGALTTVAVIGLGIAMRPSSKDEGWGIADPFPIAALSQKAEVGFIAPLDVAMHTEGSSFAIQPMDRVMSRLDWVLASLRSYADLEPEWDGIGSVTPEREHIEAAAQFLLNLPAGIELPKPMASPDGEIGLYWKNDKYFADAVIEDERHFSLFIRTQDPAPKEQFYDSIPIDPAGFSKLSAVFSSL